MVEKRNVRASEARSEPRGQQARAKTSWKPASLLDAPPARPGMVQRWVATSILGKETPIRGAICLRVNGPLFLSMATRTQLRSSLYSMWFLHSRSSHDLFNIIQVFAHCLISLFPLPKDQRCFLPLDR